MIINNAAELLPLEIHANNSTTLIFTILILKTARWDNPTHVELILGQMLSCLYSVHYMFE